MAVDDGTTTLEAERWAPPDRVPADGGRREPRLTRRGRLRKWDRPPPPHDWRWWVGNVGKTLISTGLLLFAFVAYQLWGTGIETARAQRALENDFEELLATAAPVTVPDVGEPLEPEPNADPSGDPSGDVAGEPSGDGADPEPEVPADDPPADDAAADPVNALAPVPVEAQNIPEVENGDALAKIEIPAIGVNDIVVAGVRTSDLKKGPGHFPDTPLPGQLGNSAIAGHRTTYGQPFHDVDDLEPGDEIIVTTLSGRYVYRVTGQTIVSPSDYQVVSTSDPTKATLTLTSCHPKWTARQRIVIFSELDAAASGPVGEPVLNYGRPDEDADADAADATIPGDEDLDDGIEAAPAEPEAADPADPADPAVDDPAVGADGDPNGDATGGVSGNLLEDQRVPVDPATPEQLTSPEVSEGIADAFAEGWFSDPKANAHVGFWGALLALIGIGAYMISRRFRRDWVGGLVGFVPFVVTLYFFFQNVNRLLPPNL